MSTVSNVNLFTAIVVVVILLVVIYLAFMPTPQSIWKIEKSEIYNLHLLRHGDSVPNGVEVMKSVSGPVVEVESGIIPSQERHELNKLVYEEPVLRKHHHNKVTNFTRDNNTEKDLIGQSSGEVQGENPQLQEEESNHTTVGYYTAKPVPTANELLVVKLPIGTYRDEPLQKQNSGNASMNNTSVNNTKMNNILMNNTLMSNMTVDMNNTKPEIDRRGISQPKLPDFHPPAWQRSVSVWSNKTQCRDNICSEYLSGDDRMRYLSCLSSIETRRTKPKDSICHFINGSHRPAVALVSFPGSGNTWVRGILEVATGICTGAIYCDISLRAQGFIGERIQSGSVLVVKTHSSAATWLRSHLGTRAAYFGSAIFIVRNPLEALVAEWNRKVANNFRGRTVYLESHVKSAGKEWFGKSWYRALPVTRTFTLNQLTVCIIHWDVEYIYIYI